MVRRQVFVVLIGALWLGCSVLGLAHRDVTWVSLVFFLSGLYGTILAVVGVLPRRPEPPAPDGYRPFVSVIVPARNEEGVIAETVRCLCGLDYRGPNGRALFEVIVVDHRSTDRTAAVLEALQRTLSFTVVRPTPEDGVGKAVALNVGLVAARGEVISVFDADARVAPDFLGRLVPYLARPGVAGVQARKLVYDGGRNALMRAQEDDYFVFQTLTQRSRHRLGGAVILTGNGLVTRRDTLEAVGGWNEEALTEDIDLSIRYALRGWTVHYCEDVVVWEEAVPTLRGLIQQRTRWSEGSLRCLFDHFAALLRAPVPWRKRLDFLVFLLGSLVLSLLMITSYGYLVEKWVDAAAARDVSMASALPVTAHQPLYGYYWIIVLAATVVAMAIGRRYSPLVLLWCSARYMLFAMHQIVALPLALFRYGRSVFTGRFEWMKTEHSGVGLPDLAGLRIGRAGPEDPFAVLAPVGFSAAGPEPTETAATPPP